MEKEPFDIEAAIRDVQAMVDRHDERFGRIDSKLESHDDLLTTMVQMLTRLERTQDQHSRKFVNIEEQFVRLEAKIDLRFEQMQSDFRAFKEVLLDHSQRINALEERVFS